MALGDRIKEARISHKLTQPELAKLIGVSKGTIGNYESGVSKPNEGSLIKLMNLLGVDANFLYQDEISGLLGNDPAVWHTPLDDAYAAAATQTQQNVCKLLDIGHVVPHQANRKRCMVEKVIYTYPPAAGLPLYAESDFERVEFPADEVPTGADFGLYVCGDSMQPTITDGSLIWIKKQMSVEDGQIGIFMLGDSAVCKRARVRADGRLIRLDSDNPSHEPITGADLAEARCVGKVLL